MGCISVAHCYNISKFEQYKIKTEVVGVTRAKKRSCVQRGGIFAFQDVENNVDGHCARCKNECPLKQIII